MNNLKMCVLRLGHRPTRDQRASTHLFLTARAFGADKIVYSGIKDDGLERTMRKVLKTWGGTFDVEYREDWRETIGAWKTGNREVIHLTMYGLPLLDVINQIRKSQKRKLIVVGGPKVPVEVFRLADWNVSVTSQPHSEIAALSIFLHEFFQGKELSRPYKNAELEIVPQTKGKKVVRVRSEGSSSLK